MIILKERNIKACILEKGDLISVKGPSVLLIDGIIVSGEAVVIDSIVYGNDEH